MRIVRFVLFVVLIASFCSTLTYAAADRITSAIDSANMVELARSVHPKAQAQYDQGIVEPSFPLSYLTLVMAPSPSQQKALNRLLAEQQDPASPNYHKWLTPAQYADRFGMSQADIDRITSWLKAQGFTILSVDGSRNTVVFSGTAAQVQSAFRTEIHRYSVDGEEHFANATPVMIPAALNGIVTSIRGLHNFRLKPASRFRSFGKTESRLSPDYYAPKWLFPNFLSPADVNTIYDIPSTLDGTGEKLVVVGQTDIFLNDIADFRTGFGFNPIFSGCTTTTTAPIGIITGCTTSSTANFQYVLVGSDSNPPAPSDANDLQESDLDIEWTSAIAPNAQVIFVNAPKSGVIEALAYAIEPTTGAPPLAPVISMSYGACESDSGGGVEAELAYATSLGTTILIATGDVGAAACDGNPPEGQNANPPFSPAVGGLAVSYPASSPNVTAVGGTAISLANDSYPSPSSYWNTPTTNPTNGGTAKSYIPEIAWNDDEEFASYCHSPATGDKFCSTGNGTPGWQALSTSATAAQVQADMWISSGGGGASNCAPGLSGTTCTGFPQPTWQTSLSVPNLPTGDGHLRWVPDVSLFASPNFPGYIFCTPQDPFPSSGTPTYTSTCDPGGNTGISNALNNFPSPSVIGGTSASTPAFAGMVTLLNQSLGGTGLGNINTVLYKLAQNKSNGVFHQPTGGDNDVYCQANTPSGAPANIICPSTGVFGFSTTNSDSTTGYNLVTGLGSVDVGNLVTAWAGTVAGFTLSPNPASVAAVAGHNSNSTTITITPQDGFTGTVTFTCSAGLPAGAACNFTTVNSTSSTLVIQVPANAVPVSNASVTVKGTSGAVSNTTTVSLTITATDQSFTLAAQNATYQVTQGSSVTPTVNLTPVNGFNAAVTYTCTEPATLTESTCTGPMGAVPSSQPASLTITTTAPSGELRRPFDRQRIFYAALLPGLLGIMFTFGSRKRSLRGTRMLGLILVLGSSTLWLGSCGGNSSSQKSPGTPKGSYTITVSATTGGASPVTGQTTFTLQVQ